MKKYLYLLTAVVVLSISCKKDNDTDNSPLTLLTKKVWFPTNTDPTPNLNPTGAAVLDYATCDLDDRFQFSTDGKLNIDYATSCANEIDVPDVTDFIMDAEGKTMTLWGDEVYQILELSETTLKLYDPNSSGGGGYVLVYKH